MHITAQGPPISEMTYTVSSWTLISTIPYHTSRGCYSGRAAVVPAQQTSTGCRHW